MITVCGANVTLDQVKAIEMQRPKIAGKYWQGIPHGELVNTIRDEVRGRGWKITDARFSLSGDQADLAAAFALTVPGIEAPEGQTFSLGMLTSNAMRRPLKLVVGTNVRVCSNGMATGEIVLRKKHTIGLRLSEEIEWAIDAYAARIIEIPKLVTSLRERELAPVESEHILMEAGRRGLMPWSRIGKVDEEYRSPTFAEHGKGTSWALLQAFTHIVKENPPLAQMDQMNNFRNLLPVSLATAG